MDVPVSRLAFRPESDIPAGGRIDGGLELWRVVESDEVSRCALLGAAISHVAWSPHGKQLAIAASVGQEHAARVADGPWSAGLSVSAGSLRISESRLLARSGSRRRVALSRLPRIGGTAQSTVALHPVGPFPATPERASYPGRSCSAGSSPVFCRPPEAAAGLTEIALPQSHPS